MLVILGPTASGKTKLAVGVAQAVNGEIISADSRQVYRGMDLGTGKDLEEFGSGNNAIPYHLIDIVDPGYEYNAYEFQQDFLTAYQALTEKGKVSILCGGTGLYLEAVLQGYRFTPLDANPELESFLASKQTGELITFLKSLRVPHNSTDLLDRKRLIKAIRIAIEESRQTADHQPFPRIQSLVFGVYPGRAIIRQQIAARLHQRMANGMVEEVRGLLASGIRAENLIFYGLEYKYITLYLEGTLAYQEMVEILLQRIHQFAKRQMTWFRRMEKKGIPIQWIDPSLSLSAMINQVSTAYSIWKEKNQPTIVNNRAKKGNT